MGIYTAIFYQPIFNLFVGLYNVIPGHDAGLVIIAITLIVRLVLYPFYRKQVMAQKDMQELQPKLAALKAQHADNKEAQAKAMMELYKEHKVNPFSSCLPVLIQLPIFIAVYQVLRDGLTKPESLNLLYGFVSRPELIDPHFLSLLDLSKPNAILAVLAGAAQFWQGKMLFSKRPDPALRGKKGVKDEDTMAMMNKQMMYLMPVMITFIGFSLPSGLALYWFISTAFMIVQQYVAFKTKANSSVTKIDEKTEVIASVK